MKNEELFEYINQTQRRKSAKSLFRASKEHKEWHQAPCTLPSLKYILCAFAPLRLAYFSFTRIATGAKKWFNDPWPSPMCTSFPFKMPS